MKIPHKELPDENPEKVIFDYGEEKYILTGQDLEKFFSDGNFAAVQAHLHGAYNLYHGIEWEKG